MHKKLFKILCFIMLFFGNSIFAQEKSESNKVSNKIMDHLKLSFDLGYTATNRTANLTSFVNSNYEHGDGIGMNLAAEYIFHKRFLASVGITYLPKNYSFKRDEGHTGWYTHYKQNFISVPLMLGAYVLNHPGKDKGVWIKLAAGVYGDYLLNLHKEGQYQIFTSLNTDGSRDYRKVSEKYDFKDNPNHYARYGFGLQGQVQVGYNFKKFKQRWDVFGAFNFQYGLSDIFNYDKSAVQKNTYDTMMLSIGLAYKF